MVPVKLHSSAEVRWLFFKTNNYQGISLLCILAKMYIKMIFNCMRSVIYQKLCMNQNGFLPERTTKAQILTLRRIIEEVKANNLPAIITFNDKNMPSTQYTEKKWCMFSRFMAFNPTYWGYSNRCILTQEQEYRHLIEKPMSSTSLMECYRRTH